MKIYTGNRAGKELTVAGEVAGTDVLNGDVLEALRVEAQWLSCDHRLTGQPRSEPAQVAVAVERVLEEVPEQRTYVELSPCEGRMQGNYSRKSHKVLRSRKPSNVPGWMHLMLLL